MKDSDLIMYPDGTPKTFYNDPKTGDVSYHLNRFGYKNDRKEPCRECGEWECDPNGVGHYRG